MHTSGSYKQSACYDAHTSLDGAQFAICAHASGSYEANSRFAMMHARHSMVAILRYVGMHRAATKQSVCYDAHTSLDGAQFAICAHASGSYETVGLL